MNTGICNAGYYLVPPSVKKTYGIVRVTCQILIVQEVAGRKVKISNIGRLYFKCRTSKINIISQEWENISKVLL